MGSKILSANKIAAFLKELCLENNGVNQPETLHVDSDSAKVNGNSKLLEMHDHKYYGQIMFLDS